LLGLSGGVGAGLSDAVITAWAKDRGVLENGHTVRRSVSCLLQPAIGDRVLLWSNHEDAWVLQVLERGEKEQPVVLSAEAGITIEAPRVALHGDSVQVAARDFLSNVGNRHAIEHTRTEHSKLRVSQVETDIRRVTTADERVAGTLLQRTGTWLSTTVRDARLKARTFLFE